MKKLKIVILLCTFFVFLLAGTAEAQLRFGFRLYGGLNYLSGGDVNPGTEGWADYYTTDVLHNYTPSGEFKPLHMGFDFGGDIVIQITPQIGVGLGSGYIVASKTFSIDHTHPVWDTVVLTSETKMSAIPLRLSFFYSLPLGSMIDIRFQAGAGYYLAKLNYHLRVEDPFYFEDGLYDAKGGGIGFHGGLGLEINLSPMVSLFFDLTGRYASFANFKGDVTQSSSGGSMTTHDADLYFLKAQDFPYGTFSILMMDTTKPSGPDLTLVRLAKVDFSGFLFFTGFIFRF
jgi:hypothetical protein